MTRYELIEQIKLKKSFLCVGLDPDLTKIPAHLHRHAFPLFEFCKQIIDATHLFCVAYKPNTAFFEAYGSKGWQNLEMTIAYLKQKYPNHFTIADAKRGDLGNTGEMYAKAFLQKMDFDSITVAPYMGSDSIKPFLTIKNKWAVILGLTSNEGAADFQFSYLNELNTTHAPRRLFEEVLEHAKDWGDEENIMFVIGATKAEWLKSVRKIVPNHFLLIPGVGAQGGSLEEVCKNGMTKDIALLINASRSILYASNQIDFEKAAAREAEKIKNEMERFLSEFS